MDRDVAHRRLGVHRDRLLARLGTLACVQVVLHGAELRVQIEPGGDALGDADLDLPEPGLGDDRAALDPAQPDVPVRGLGDQPRVRVVDRDPAVGAVHPRLAHDLPDPRLAVPVLDDRTSVDARDLHRTGAGRDLGSPTDPVDGDVAGAGPELDGAGLVDPDVPHAGPELALAEATGDMHRPRTHLTREARVGGDVYADVDRLVTERAPGGPLAPALRGADQEPAVRVLDARLLRREHVDSLGRVTRTHVDHGVGTLSRGEPEVADVELHGDQDRVGGLEGLHGTLLSTSGPSPSSAVRRTTFVVGADLVEPCVRGRRRRLGRATS